MMQIAFPSAEQAENVQQLPDIGAHLNRILETSRTKVFELAEGYYNLATPIRLDIPGKRFVLAGQGHIQTHLVIPPRQKIIGLDARRSREVTLQELRVIEASGSQESCCLAGTGMSLKARGLWLGNAKYGFVGNTGSGGTIYDIQIEACQEAIRIQSNFVDMQAGIDWASNIRCLIGENIRIYNCAKAVTIRQGTSNRTAKIRLEGMITACNEGVYNDTTMGDDCDAEFMISG